MYDFCVPLIYSAGLLNWWCAPASFVWPGEAKKKMIVNVSRKSPFENSVSVQGHCPRTPLPGQGIVRGHNQIP